MKDGRFPEYVMLFMTFYVGRWFVHVVTRDDWDVLMMVSCNSYEDAESFLKTYSPTYELS